MLSYLGTQHSALSTQHSDVRRFTRNDGVLFYSQNAPPHSRGAMRPGL